MCVKLIIFILTTSVCYAAGADYCNNGWDLNRTGPVRQSRPVPEPSAELTCLGRRHELWCCVQGGFTKILWYFSENGASSWELVDDKFDDDGLEYYYLHRNSTLVLTSPNKYKHTGNYKCVATSGTSGRGSYQHHISLGVRRCVQKQVTPMSCPLSHTKQYIAEIGQNFNMTCTAFFGDASYGHTISWRILYNSSYLYATDYPGHTEEKFIKNSNRYITSILYITNIQKVNYRYVYQCYMTDFDPKDKKTCNFTIREGDPEDPDGEKHILKSTIYIIATCVAFCIITLGICCYCCWKYNLEIQLWFRDKCSQSKEEDANVNNYFGGIEKSRRVIMIASPAMLKCNWCKYVFHEAMEEYSRLIIVLFKNITREKWIQQRKTGDICIRRAMNVITTIRWPDYESLSKAVSFCSPCVSGRQQSQNRKQLRQIDKFWKHLRLALPVLPQKGDAESRSRNRSNTSASSTHPLMSSNLNEDTGIQSVECSAENKSCESNSDNSSDEVFVESKEETHGETFR